MKLEKYSKLGGKKGKPAFRTPSRFKITNNKPSSKQNFRRKNLG
jgi:hypothetical protein